VVDKYPNFNELRKLEREGHDFAIVLSRRYGSDTAVIAPHGGAIEHGTSEIAKAIAGDTYHLYCFEGRKNKTNRNLHITSINFDEPQAVAMVAECSQVVAVHGLAGHTEEVEVSGKDVELRGRIHASLEKAGFASRIVTSGPYAAANAHNICNRGRAGKGAQLEITCGLRDRLRAEPKLLEDFAEAVRQAIKRK